MLKFRASIKRLLCIICVLFVIAGVYIVKTVIDKDTFLSNPYNKRLYLSEEGVKRGSIEDTNGVVLAESILKDDSYERVYNFPEYVSNITGYTEKGKTGVESAYNYHLEDIDNELIQRIKNVLFDDEILCKNAVLTIDLELQKTALNVLGDNKGAVVVMEFDTGKIKAMASNPSFNSNTVYDDWEKLNNDETGPLLNRAAQGLYTPGSTFKIITLLSALENMPEVLSEEYECNGSEYFDGKIIRCFNETSHGKITAKDAFSQSCNCYFSRLGEKLGPEKLRLTAEKLGINSGIDFDLNYSVSSIEIESDAILSEIVETSIGQGKTLITPLQMAMITSSVINEGKMMKPYILDYVKNADGTKESRTIPEPLLQAMSPQNSIIIKDYMINVVENGTGYAAKKAGYVIGGKTGTAENPTGSDHLWFTGFCGNTVVTVVLENPEGGLRATEAAKVIFDYIYE